MANYQCLQCKTNYRQGGKANNGLATTLTPVDCRFYINDNKIAEIINLNNHKNREREREKEKEREKERRRKRERERERER